MKKHNEKKEEIIIMSWIPIEDPFEADTICRVEGPLCFLSQAAAWWGAPPDSTPFLPGTRLTVRIKVSRDVVVGLAFCPADSEGDETTAQEGSMKIESQPPGSYRSSCGVRTCGVVLSGGYPPCKHVVGAANMDETITVIIDFTNAQGGVMSYGVFRPPRPKDWTDVETPEGLEPTSVDPPVVTVFEGLPRRAWLVVSNPDMAEACVEMVGIE